MLTQQVRSCTWYIAKNPTKPPSSSLYQKLNVASPCPHNRAPKTDHAYTHMTLIHAPCLPNKVRRVARARATDRVREQNQALNYEHCFSGFAWRNHQAEQSKPPVLVLPFLSSLLCRHALHRAHHAQAFVIDQLKHHLRLHPRNLRQMSDCPCSHGRGS